VSQQPLHPAHQRVLEAAARKGVSLHIQTFADTTHTAEDAARAVGAELGQIVKSLVFVSPTAEGLDPILALVSGANRVDLGRLAAVAGAHGVRPATAREAGDLSGFVIGGIPPIGHTRPMRVVMDPDLGRFQQVWAAAGTQNAVFMVPPGTLRMISNAIVAPIAIERPSRFASGAEGSSAGDGGKRAGDSDGDDDAAPASLASGAAGA
jgi:prolyl-tRNA editing enzyme YbaK/EbsC (Cys-tRNA(Pro) deacylase)